MEDNKKLPEGWIKVRSKTRPDKEYYYNKKLKISCWKLNDIKEVQKNGEWTGNGAKKYPDKQPKKSFMSSPPKKSSGTTIQSRNIKKNIARDRMLKLQKVLSEEVKRGLLTKVNKDNPQQTLLVPTKILKKNNVPNEKKEISESLLEKGKEVKRDNFTKSSSATNFVLKQPMKYKEKDSRLVLKKSDSSLDDVEMTDISMENPNLSKSLELLEDFEPMDWEDVPELEVISKVQSIRTAAAQLTTVSTSQDRLHTTENQFIVVCDTNVLLSNIDFLKEIKGKVFKGEINILKSTFVITFLISLDIGKATIYLPYIVLCELDNLKTHNDNVARLARRSIAFIDNCFKNKDPFLIGQSALDSVQKQIIPIDCGDDKILNCCLQIQEITKKLILLTNDKNLRNKAFVNKIEAFSRDMLNFVEFNIKNEIKFE